MAKKSRKFDPNKGTAGGGSATTGSSGTSVAGESFLEKYRTLVIGAVIVAVVAVIGFLVLSAASASAYTCESLLQAQPIATSAPGSAAAEARLGFGVEDTGRSHAEGAISYASCPPTSGDHRAAGALPRRFYGAGSIQLPNDWVHNLEHGYAVIAYRGDPGAEVLSELREAMDAPEPSDVAQQCGLPNKVIALRFDDMAEPFAVLAWDRALLLSEFDAELVTRAAAQFQDQPQAPERAC